jgi:hypothetical protein
LRRTKVFVPDQVRPVPAYLGIRNEKENNIGRENEKRNEGTLQQERNGRAAETKVTDLGRKKRKGRAA